MIDFTKHEAPAVVQHRPPVPVAVGQEAEHGVDLAGARGRWPGKGAGEEVWPAVVDVVDEDAVHMVWEKLAVREQQLAGVHDGAPRLADATGLGEAPRRQAAEDVGEGIVGERCHFRRRLHAGWVCARVLCNDCVTTYKAGDGGASLLYDRCKVDSCYVG